MSRMQVKSMEQHLHVGQKLHVKVIGRDKKGNINVSHRVLLPREAEAEQATEKPPGSPTWEQRKVPMSPPGPPGRPSGTRPSGMRPPWRPPAERQYADRPPPERVSGVDSSPARLPNRRPRNAPLQPQEISAASD